MSAPRRSPALAQTARDGVPGIPGYPGTLAGHTGPRSWTVPMHFLGPPLTLNQRLHWHAAAILRRSVIDDCVLTARSVKLPKGLDRVHVVLHWQPSVKRRRDTDNPTPTLKAAIDALVIYGLVDDDDSSHVSSAVVIEPVANPAAGLWLTIDELRGEA